MSDKYILDENGQPAVEHDLMRWAQWWESADKQRILAHTHVGNILVSTVFLGLDHRHFGEGPPLLWESMVFGGNLDESQQRYSTREAALAGHAELVRKVKETLP